MALSKSYYTVEGEILGERTPGGGRVNYGVDALGSVTSTLVGDAVQNRYAYKPYGSLLSRSGVGADPSFLWVGTLGYRQTGRTYSESYVRARHYAQTLGRWTSVDPLWPDEGAYLYAAQAVTTHTDPLGLVLINSCGTNIDKTLCIKQAPLICPCLSNVFVTSARASFAMSLPASSSSTLAIGSLWVHTEGIIQYSGSGCPPNETWQTDEYFTVTSGAPNFQVLGRYWGKYFSQKTSSWRNEPSPIPPNTEIVGGQWTISTQCLAPTVAAETLPPSEGYRFVITPDPADRSSRITPDDKKSHNTRKQRSLFRVHPDGGATGSAGCISPRTPQEARRLRSCLENIHGAGLASVPLTVQYS